MFHPQEPQWLPRDLGSALADDGRLAAPAATVLDCGPAGEPGFTHALYVDPATVPAGYCRALEAEPRIEQAVWPGGDRVYVRAAMMLGEEVFATAHAVAEALKNPDERDERSDMGNARDDGFDALARVAKDLDGEPSFAPDVTPADAPLPGRGSGTWPPAFVDDAGILDCGTSRADGYTHVLWMDPSVVPEAIADQVAALDDVVKVGWESAELLHVDAPGVSHDDLLEQARRLARA
ncbi:hypothetical protein [Demequina sp. NBRC 110051]|uniref:hypothetical protein n=1 Tax=Demequina sp. NBRC 110051 TaxID=1570340 RepID=UPI000A063F53|nr:hypothetical protein [Demequina sp. NBRC 110051]